MLVIAPPLEPTLRIRLHSWLNEVVMADVDQTIGSWGEETLLKSSLRTPIPLLEMFGELPYVAEVAEEPYRGGEWDVGSDWRKYVTRRRLYSDQAVPGDSKSRVNGMPRASSRFLLCYHDSLLRRGAMPYNLAR